MGIFIFCKAIGARALSLTTGLLLRIQLSLPGLISVSGWESKRCFKLLKAEAGSKPVCLAFAGQKAQLSNSPTSVWSVTISSSHRSLIYSFLLSLVIQISISIFKEEEK